MFIKAIARNHWRPGEHAFATWYEPLDEQPPIDAAVAFALSRPTATGIATAGDVRLLPLMIEAERRAAGASVEEAADVLVPCPGDGAAIRARARTRHPRLDRGDRDGGLRRGSASGSMRRARRTGRARDVHDQRAVLDLRRELRLSGEREHRAHGVGSLPRDPELEVPDRRHGVGRLVVAVVEQVEDLPVAARVPRDDRRPDRSTRSARTRARRRSTIRSRSSSR